MEVTHGKQRVAEMLEEQLGDAMLLLRRAVHLERQDDGQIGSDERALGNCDRHFLELLNGAECVPVRHDWLSLPVPAVDLDVAAALKQECRRDAQEAFARTLV